ncbi:hypothetical protein L3X40_06230, partial [Rhizorhapis sp. SPR117]|nr:hypothetical protein [Rhizorhapis sp. SPR117]
MDKPKTLQSEFKAGLEEAVLHSILSTVPDAMIVIDSSGRILSFSVPLFGGNPPTSVGKRLQPLPRGIV